MCIVYRGWIVSETDDGGVKAKKGEEVIIGQYEDVLREIDNREFRKQEEEI
jgi:hypothetical protein